MELQQQDKKSFGSFHSDNVELLIRQPPDAYVEPQLPVPLGELLPDGFPSFGHGMRDTHFLLDPEWTFINHGAFGTPLRVAVEGGNLWRLHCARQPLRFIDRQLFPLVCSRSLGCFG
jgi:isopenicillin-N epimerase